MKKITFAAAALTLLASPALAATLVGSARYTALTQDRVVVAPTGSTTSVFLCNTGNTDGRYAFRTSPNGPINEDPIEASSCVMVTNAVWLVLRGSASGWAAKADFYLP